MLQNCLWVALGGALGSCGRYGLSLLLNAKAGDFPYGTFTVNLLGSLILGILMAASFWEGDKNLGVKLFLTTGLMGGFTTYSTFSFETMSLLRQGELVTGFSYMGITVVVCLLASFSGFWLGRQIF